VTALSALAAEVVRDPNARLSSLQVNRKGEALLTYRRADGRVRHVLVWGAVNARVPSPDVPQGPVRLRLRRWLGEVSEGHVLEELPQHV
jgi:hypothetical protein